MIDLKDIKNKFDRLEIQEKSLCLVYSYNINDFLGGECKTYHLTSARAEVRNKANSNKFVIIVLDGKKQFDYFEICRNNEFVAVNDMTEALYL